MKYGYTVSLVAERGSVSFTMFSGGQESFSFIPRWNEEAATMESFDQRVKFFMSSTKEEERYLCGPRLLSTFDPERDSFRHVRDNLINVQLEAADGSGALMIVKTTGLSVGPKSTQEAVRLLLDSFRLDSLRRNYGETNHETLDTSIHTAILESRPSTERFKCQNQRGLFCTKTFEVFCWLRRQE